MEMLTKLFDTPTLWLMRKLLNYDLSINLLSRDVNKSFFHNQYNSWQLAPTSDICHTSL